MNREQRIRWMYFDAKMEGTSNPVIRLYYWLRMKGVELMAEREEKRMTIRIDADLHRRFKVLSVERDFSMNDKVEELIKQYVEEQEQEES